jgi:hypothetical protein
MVPQQRSITCASGNSDASANVELPFAGTLSKERVKLTAAGPGEAIAGVAQARVFAAGIAEPIEVGFAEPC